jgi:SHS family lactate transporter-like MFS transporter
MAWTRAQKHVVVAAFLGWTLDAFDFFLMVFVLKDIAKEFGVAVSAVALGITLTLAMRPVGALIFGRLADRYGRRPTLMANVLCFSLFGLLSGFAPTLTALLVLRTLFGVAMGGEWGVGSALTMESIPASSRGAVSGLLQAGYPSGYLLAAVVYGLFYEQLGWRGMFFVGVAPALLVLYIRAQVPESPAWTAARERPRTKLLATLKTHWKLSLYAIALMTAFNFFSHGTHDLYPTFLQVQRKLDTKTVSLIAIVYNIGAILGGLAAGALSERYGRRRMIAIAALLALPVIPLWSFAGGSAWLACGAFLINMCVQGAWAIVPAHLNELAPAEARATFPGLMYQLGNLLAAVNATLQARIAESHGGDYALAQSLVVGIVVVVLAALALAGPERRGEALGS